MTDENKALAVQDDAQLPAPSESGRMLAMIHQAATDPTVDAQKMVTLADLAIKLQDRERENEFRRAKVAALLEISQLRISRSGAILNKAGGVQSRYSRFEDIHRLVTPILASHQLAVSFEIGQAGQLVTVRPILTHANGYQERGEAMPLTIDTTGSKNATMGAGSAASYGKRHTFKALVNLIEEREDDDGQAAGPTGRALTPDQQRLVREGEAAARNGIDSYDAWWSGLSTPQKGWLVIEGKHPEWKQLAQANGGTNGR